MANGVVSTISTKAWYDSKRGSNINLYSFQLEGDRSWYRTGTNPPPFNKGDAVEFEVVDAKGSVDMKSIRRLEGAPAPVQDAPAAQPTNRARPAQGGSRDDYWKDKEARDIEKDARFQEIDVPRMTFSAAQDRAVNLVCAAMEHECISFGNATKGKRLDILLDAVDLVTQRFLIQTMDAHLILANVRAETAEIEEVYGQPEAGGVSDYE